MNEVDHQLYVIERALERLEEWATEPNIFIKINEIENEVDNLRILFSQVIQ